MNQTDTLFQQALALHQQGQLHNAATLYQQVLRLHPNHFDALHLLGVITAQSGQTQQALALIGQAIALNPSHPQAHFNYARAFHQLGQLDLAATYYEKAIALDPHQADAHNNLCSILYQLKRLDEALVSVERALILAPEMAQAHNNRGLILNDLHRFHEALSSYDRALSLNPEFAECHYNRGNTLRELNQFEAAKASFRRAIDIRPDYAKAHNNYGYALFETLCLDQAEHHYQLALAINPDLADAHINLAVLYLLTGRFQLGWKEYEWRWKLDTLELYSPQQRFTQPLWLGHEPLAGKTILLHAEQGLGDTLQFCRYARLVTDLGAQVILEAQAPLVPLLSRLNKGTPCIAQDDQLPHFDHHCPLMSLPLAFKTTLDTIPDQAGYLNSDPQRVARWQSRLGQYSKPRIGLSWRGNPAHRNDHHRSISLKALLEMLPTHFQYVSLQKDLLPVDHETLAAFPNVLHFEQEISDFDDTAALCELIDLIISIDSSVAHLAGALGKPVWILLPKAPDWRWLLDRSDTPWYPSATLYRQTEPMQWDAVFQQVSHDLQVLFSDCWQPQRP